MRRIVIFIFQIISPFILQAQINRDILMNIPGMGKVLISTDHTWLPVTYDSLSDEGMNTATNCDSILLGKYIQNRGQGDDELSSARNLRTVLTGVLYRGGGNNRYNAICNRDNNNPLSMDGVLSLASNGFSHIIYLYEKNFNFYFPSHIESSLRNASISYQSIVPNEDSVAFRILARIHEHIKQPGMGAIYMHCWNGWHMSGMMAAYALMQFCDFSNNAALAYWKKGTDGNDKGYEKVKQRILKFNKYPDLPISLGDKLRICPCIK